MNRILDLVGMSIGGWIGWIAGAWISFFSKFLLSMIGTGLGLYATRRVIKRLLP